MKIKIVVRNLVQIFLLGGLILLFTSCLPKQADLKRVFQSNSATIIRKDQMGLKKLLIEFKKKLDKRNPNNFNKRIKKDIVYLILNQKKSLFLEYRNKKIDNYKTYLQIAFSKDEVIYRNDFLILGIYYQLYDVYNFEDTHKIIALQYNREKLIKLHKNLQVIKWKIKVDRDINNEYLFLTWQNNWQVELEKMFRENREITFLDLKELKYLKEKKESLLDHSNFSFEVLLTQMIDKVESSLVALGEEPKELTVKALFLFF